MTDSEKLDLILEKITEMDKRLNRLEVGQAEIKREIYSLDRRISDTYKVALDAWGQGIETKTWLENGGLKV